MQLSLRLKRLSGEISMQMGIKNLRKLEGKGEFYSSGSQE
jgi:hypothetical protein